MQLFYHTATYPENTHACTHMNTNYTREKKIIRMNKARLKLQLHDSLTKPQVPHTHTAEALIYSGYWYTLIITTSLFPPASPSSHQSVIASRSVAVRNELKQFHLRAEKQTLSPLCAYRTLCGVKAFNQALVYFVFVYYVIVRTQPPNVLCCFMGLRKISKGGEIDRQFHN